jgi:hypothetical protein
MDFSYGSRVYTRILDECPETAEPFFIGFAKASPGDWPFFDLKKALSVKQKSTG